jgi:hypothetical protein
MGLGISLPKDIRFVQNEFCIPNGNICAAGDRKLGAS